MGSVGGKIGNVRLGHRNQRREMFRLQEGEVRASCKEAGLKGDKDYLGRDHKDPGSGVQPEMGPTEAPSTADAGTVVRNLSRCLGTREEPGRS